MLRRPKPCKSGYDGCAPTATLLAAASEIVRSITFQSPACSPQAILAELTKRITSASLPRVQRPKLSPTSALISIRFMSTFVGPEAVGDRYHLLSSVLSLRQTERGSLPPRSGRARVAPAVAGA